MRYIILSLLLTTSTFAQVTYVSKGDSAPFNGYLFSPDLELKARKALIDADTYQAIIANNDKLFLLKDKEIELTNTQADLWKNQSKDLAVQLEDSKNSSFWKSFAYFGLGCILTTGLAFAVNHATK